MSERITEIEARMAEIKTQLDSADSEALDALTSEVDSLLAERKQIEEDAEKRQALRNQVADNVTEVKVAENFEIEQKEEKTMVDYRSAFLKNLQGVMLNEEERTAITAASAIPTETMNKIIAKLEGNPIFSAVDTSYIPGNVSFPIESTINDANWVAMGTAATDSADSLGSISLAAYKLIKTVEVTADVQAMAIDDFENWLVNRLADKIGKAVDVAILTGTGTNQAKGILVTKATADGTYTSTGATYKDICAIIGSLPTRYHSNASFVMPRALFFGQVLGMVDSNKNRVVVADAQAPAKFNILGYPVIVDDNCTADNILFGDFKAYKFNFAKAPEITSDDSVAFRTGSRVWRAMALADGKLADSDAIVRYTKATA